jgi:hypothetical protein
MAAAGGRGREGRQILEMPPILGRTRRMQSREQAGIAVLIRRFAAALRLKNNQ